MKACNGNKRLVERTPISEEEIEITRLEPVVLEVAREQGVSSHLILFEIKCRIGMEQEEMVVDGDIKETIYEIQERPEDDF